GKIVTYFFLLGVPYYFLVASDRSNLHHLILRSPWVTDIDEAIVLAGMLSLGSFLFSLVGASVKLMPSRVKKSLGDSAQQEQKGKKGRLFFKRALPLFVIGLAIYVWYISRIGGLGYLWRNLVYRTQLTAGLGYVSSVYR